MLGKLSGLSLLKPQNSLAVVAARGLQHVSAAALPDLVSTKGTLEELKLEESTYTRELPGDPEASNELRQVFGAFYSYVQPTPTGTTPYIAAYSRDMAERIGLNPAECERPEFAAAFSGNAVLPGAAGRSFAHCYGGHQFGYWAGQLGDGRAISLGDAIGPDSEHWELQLKGAGRTPYSRRADGRAVMRSSLREFVASEAMHALGVPTTRALSLVGTGSQVYRDMFYNGNARLEPGAVVCRAAPTFIRFGHFQLPAMRDREQWPLIRQLADYVIRHHFKHLQGEPDQYARFLREVCERTGRLFARWQALGFTHGVLNTDNMSILGLTIDYGPFGFVEQFDPLFTPNTSDLPGRRYCFRNQATIGSWNCDQLAEALVVGGLLSQEEATEAVDRYSEVMTDDYKEAMRAKLGLRAYDKDLAVAFLTAIYEDRADFTNAFRALADVSADPAQGMPETLQQVLGTLSEPRQTVWTEFLAAYRGRLQSDGLPEKDRTAMQRAASPAYIPRNHLMQEAIGGAEEGDFSELHSLMAVLERPYEARAGLERYTRVGGGPDGKVRAGIEMLSCSS